MAYVKTDENGRITATSEEFHLGSGEMVFDFPEDFAFENQMDFRIVNGELVCDPLPVPEAAPDPVQALEEENALLKAQVQALDQREEFLEECLAELAGLVLSEAK